MNINIEEAERLVRSILLETEIPQEYSNIIRSSISSIASYIRISATNTEAINRIQTEIESEQEYIIQDMKSKYEERKDAKGILAIQAIRSLLENNFTDQKLCYQLADIVHYEEKPMDREDTLRMHDSDTKYQENQSNYRFVQGTKLVLEDLLQRTIRPMQGAGIGEESIRRLMNQLRLNLFGNEERLTEILDQADEQMLSMINEVINQIEKDPLQEGKSGNEFKEGCRVNNSDGIIEKRANEAAKEKTDEEEPLKALPRRCDFVMV